LAACQAELYHRHLAQVRHRARLDGRAEPHLPAAGATRAFQQKPASEDTLQARWSEKDPFSNFPAAENLLPNGLLIMEAFAIARWVIDGLLAGAFQCLRKGHSDCPTAHFRPLSGRYLTAPEAQARTVDV
jgi:hypothetical protein